VLCARALFANGFTVMTAVGLGLCFLFLGEETSWFQRQLGYSVEAVEGMNGQGEFNFHNLTIFTPTGWRQVDSFESFLRALMNSQNLFQMGFAIFFLAIPIAAAFGFASGLRAAVGYVTPSAVFVTVTWGLVALSYAYVSVATGEPHKDALVETRELIFATAICGYAAMLRCAPRRNADPSSET